MRGQRDIDSAAWVRDVVIDLLLKTLPLELRAAAPELADRVGEHPSIKRQFGKRWGDLSEGEGNIIAREVGVIARGVIEGAGANAASGEHLH
jgi:hypothetical protein